MLSKQAILIIMVAAVVVVAGVAAVVVMNGDDNGGSGGGAGGKSLKTNLEVGDYFEHSYRYCGSSTGYVEKDNGSQKMTIVAIDGDKYTLSWLDDHGQEHTQKNTKEQVLAFITMDETAKKLCTRSGMKTIDTGLGEVNCIVYIMELQGTKVTYYVGNDDVVYRMVDGYSNVSYEYRVSDLSKTNMLV